MSGTGAGDDRITPGHHAHHRLEVADGYDQGDVHDLVGCYVVDGLDATERDAFEAHLPGCENCTCEVEELTETTAELASLAAAGPPPSVRDSILDTIRTMRPLPPALDDAPPQSPPPAAEDTVTRTENAVESSAETSVGGVAMDEPGNADELAEHRLRRLRRRLRASTALLAAAVVAVVALGLVVVNLNQRNAADVAAQAAVQREVDLLAAPDTQVITRTRAGARYRFVVSRQRNEALLIPSGLPDPGAGNTYQLWTLQGSRATPDATMPADARRQWFTGPVDASTTLAVTVEPDGGSLQPTSPIVAQAPI